MSAELQSSSPPQPPFRRTIAITARERIGPETTESELRVSHVLHVIVGVEAFLNQDEPGPDAPELVRQLVAREGPDLQRRLITNRLVKICPVSLANISCTVLLHYRVPERQGKALHVLRGVRRLAGAGPLAVASSSSHDAFERSR